MAFFKQHRINQLQVQVAENRAYLATLAEANRYNAHIAGKLAADIERLRQLGVVVAPENKEKA